MSVSIEPGPSPAMPGDVEHGYRPGRHHRGGPPRRPTLTQLILAAILVAVVGTAVYFHVTGGTTKKAAVVDPTSTATQAGMTAVDSAAYPLSAIAAAAPGAKVVPQTIKSGGLIRNYLIIAPASQTGPLPMIVFLHGQAVTATQEALRDETLPLVADGKAILVYPSGYSMSWNADALGCCGTAGKVNIRDVDFVTAVVRATQGMVSSSKVFLAGYSNGGKLAYDIMCQQPEAFSAFAIASATPLAACTAAKQPARSALLMVGSTDGELPISGSPQPASAALSDAWATWRDRNGCSGISTGTRGVIQMTVATTCTDNTSVVAALYTGQGHSWFTTTASTPGSTALMWSFFNGQALF